MSNSTVTFSDVFKDKFLSGFSLATQNLTLPNSMKRYCEAKSSW